MSTSPRTRPDASEYAPRLHGYVTAVPDGDVVSLMRDGGREMQRVLATVPEARGGHRYAEGKWTVREMAGHLIDAERIFSYRALRIARGDATPLPAFEENDYVRAAGSDARTLASLAAELAVVRESTAQLFASLPDEAWARRGTMSGNGISVRALAYLVVGHAQHHLMVLRERYGIG